MDRREFLKLGAVLGTALALTPLVNLPAQAAASTPAAARRLKGTSDGRLLESLDSGQTWQTLVSFGSQLAITRVVQGRKELQLHMRLVDGSRFTLRSTNAGQTWHTLAYRSPKS